MDLGAERMKYLERVAFVVLFVPLALISGVAWILSLIAIIPGLVIRFLTEGPTPADKYLDWCMDKAGERFLLKAPVFVWLESIQRRTGKSEKTS